MASVAMMGGAIFIQLLQKGIPIVTQKSYKSTPGTLARAAERMRQNEVARSKKKTKQGDSPRGRDEKVRLITNAYDTGYRHGYRDARVEQRDKIILTQDEARAIAHLALKIGYISHEKHEAFHELLNRVDAFLSEADGESHV